MEKVKIFFNLVLTVLFVSISTEAQVFTLAKELKTKYAVPDAPAFTMLDVSPSNILKPASVKDIAIGFSNFLDADNKISLPKSLAVEFSPGLLMNGQHLTLEEYRKHPGLYRLRLSLATTRSDSSSSATNLAFGIRVTLNDDSDPRTNDEYIKEATNLAEAIQKLVDARRKELGPLATMEEIENDVKFEAAKKKLIDKFKVKWLEEKWNKNISEIAFALKTSSQDSLAKNLKLNKFSLWYASAYGYEDWGQFLFCVNVSSEKDLTTNKFQSSGSIATRLYLGTNEYKVYLQAEGTMVEESKSNWLLNSGFELRVQENLWAEFTAGIENNNQINENMVVTGFKLKYGL